MGTSSKRKTVILRAVRSAVAVGVSGLIAWLAGPDVADIVGSSSTAVLLGAILTPLLTAGEKWLRYGSDPGEVK